MTKKIGLRNKITTSIVLTILLLGLSISFMMNVIVQDILREQLMGKGVFIARSLSARSTLPILTENWFDLKYLIENEKTLESDIAYVFVVDSKDNILTHTFKEGFPVELKGVNSVRPSKISSTQLLDTGEGFIYDIAVPISAEDEIVGTVRVGITEENIRKTINNALGLTIGITVLAILLSIFIGFGLAGLIIKPVRELHRAAEEMAKGNLDVRAEVRTGDEIHELAETFNLMAASLKSYRTDLEEKIEERTLELHREIAERKGIEKTLRASEGQLKNIVENAGEIIYTLTPDGIFKFVSPAWTRLLGHKISEVEGHSFIPFVHPDDVAVCQAFLKKVMITGEPQHGVKYRVKHKDKSWRWHSSAGAPVKDEEGNIPYYVGIAEDITECKKTEERLKQASAIINRSPAVAFLWKNAPGWPVEFVSENVKRLFGYSAKDFTSGKVPFAEVVHSDDLARVGKEVENHSKDEGTSQFTQEYRIITKDKQEKWIEDKTLIRRNSNGKAIYYEGIICDITERKRAEKELVLAREKLASAEKLALLGQFAGVVSHEFRNELGVMRNSVYFLGMKLRGKKDEDKKVKRHLDILEEEITNTDEIIKDILTFARPKPPVFENVNIGNLLLKSIDKVNPPGKINVVTLVDKNLPEIKADPAQLSQVFINIILNAVQAMEKGGDLSVKAAKEGGFVDILFEDTGNGIKEDDLKRIFEPFFSTKARGTGLGLSTAKLLVEGHSGSIDAKNRSGEGGTVIKVRLPISPSVINNANATALLKI